MLKKISCTSMLLCLPYVICIGDLTPLTETSASLGRCPLRTVQRSFDISRHVGTWYAYSRFGKFFPNYYFDCQRHHVSLRTANENETSIKTFLKMPTSPYLEFELIGTGKYTNATQQDGNLDIVYEIPGFGKITQHHSLLGSYMKDALLLWTCADFKTKYFESAIILTRYRTLENVYRAEEMIRQIESIAQEKGLDPSAFSRVDQEKCGE